MFYTTIGILIRIFSNSYLNVFQKILTHKGEKSSVVNFYTYLGLTLISVWFLKDISLSILPLILIMGLLGAGGNYFIIKALSIGELSTLAPINSYKPVVALFFGIFFLKEIPSISAILAILLIIAGTYFVLDVNGKAGKLAILYRVIALICSGTEAVFIKKIILLCGANNCFILWALSGLIFSSAFVLFSKHKPVIKDYKYQILLILAVGIMQYSTNFVFARMNVSYALALFQLSPLLSVFLGANIFHEKFLLFRVCCIQNVFLPQLLQIHFLYYSSYFVALACLPQSHVYISIGSRIKKFSKLQRNHPHIPIF